MRYLVGGDGYHHLSKGCISREALFPGRFLQTQMAHRLKNRDLLFPGSLGCIVPVS